MGRGGKGRGGAEVSPEERRQTRKTGRRAAQLEKMDEKGQTEASYFWDCKAASQRAGKSGAKENETELFAKQNTYAIDFAKYDSVQVTRSGPGAESAKVMDSFQDLGSKIPDFLSRNLALMHYNVPTPIQKHSLPLALQGLDLMCCAQTGSGKTAAFLLPVVASLSSPGCRPACLSDGPDDPALPRCVIMAPTRELIQQIHAEALKCCYKSGGLRAVVIYGGANSRQQLAELARGCDIAVATPGRLTDFVDRWLVELRMVTHLVLDEADRMLDMGFEPQIRKLVQKCDMPDVSKRRTLMFSATFPPEIQKLAKAFLNPYVFIAIGRVGGTTENIEQRLVWASAEKRQKFDLLLEELKRVQGKTLVFVQKKRVATQIKKWLLAEGESAEDIHGDRSQSQREAALWAFRNGECRILCATDVAARGLDIPSVAHVINFDLPTSPDEFDAYVHRIGRTGRAGNTGISTSFYVPGRDPKVGNAGIAPDLYKIFKETKNDIPGWFWELPEAAALGSKSGDHDRRAKAAGDIRGGQAVVQTRTSTRNGDAAKATPFPTSSPAATFQNCVNALSEAVQKRKFTIYYEEAADPQGGFWCEASVYNQSESQICRGEASSSQKKNAKYDAAKACLEALEKVLKDVPVGQDMAQGRGRARGTGNGANGRASKYESEAHGVNGNGARGNGASSRATEWSAAEWSAWESSNASSAQWGDDSAEGGSRRQGRNGPRVAQCPW